MGSISVDMDEPRNEGLKEIIYYFIYKSVRNNAGRIPGSLEKINKILSGGMVEQEILKVLLVRYLRESDTSDPVQIGEAKITIDWSEYALQLKAGNKTLTIDKDDPLGTMSPAMSDLANELRKRGVKQGVNSLTWSVTWIDRVWQSDSTWDALNKRFGLVRSTDDKSKYASAANAFARAKKKKIVVQLDDAREVGFEVLWLDDT